MTACKRSPANSHEDNKGQYEDIRRRLDALISLLSLMVPGEIRQTDKILLLASHGFTPTEIAVILRTTSNTVNVALSRSRKGKKQSPESAGGSMSSQDSQPARSSGEEI